MMTDPLSVSPRVFGRYAIFDKIASGGMASVHYGRLMGPAGFSRTVAIKRLHAEYARDAEFVAAFLDEARLAARIRHLNVVPTLDVVAVDEEVLLVMEYVQGEALSRILKRLSTNDQLMPHRIVASVLSGVLQGLHAAHEATDERGRRLDLVHRDVSPHNILLGADGLARVVDFGVAKAEGRASVTKEARIKGKLSYMAPEQITNGIVSQACDIYSTSVVLWEALTGHKLFYADNSATTIGRIVAGDVPVPSSLVPDLPRAYDEVVMRGLDRDPAKRHTSALEMALALERCGEIESPVGVAVWLKTVVGQLFSERAERVAAIERDSEVSGVEEIRRIAAQVASDPRKEVSASPAAAAAPSPASSAPGTSKLPPRWILAGGAVLLVLLALGLTIARMVAQRSGEANAVEGITVASSTAVSTTTSAPSQIQTQPSAAPARPSAPASGEAEPPESPSKPAHAAKRPAGKKGSKPGSPYDSLGGRL
jgi:eukaryotic-like serine/threonine-protein kinase